MGIYENLQSEFKQNRADGRKRAAAQYGFHSFRHSAASRMIEAGVPMPLVADIVGHGNPAMTEHYYHASDEANRRAVLAIGTGTKKAGARERLLEVVERATDAECEKMLAALEKAGKRDGSGDKPGEDGQPASQRGAEPR